MALSFTSFTTSAEACQNFKISPPHFSHRMLNLPSSSAFSFLLYFNICTIFKPMYIFMTKSIPRTFVIFKSVTFEFFLKIMESVGDDAKSVFHEDQKFFKSNPFESDTIFVTFQKVLILMSIMICKKIWFSNIEKM